MFCRLISLENQLLLLILFRMLRFWVLNDSGNIAAVLMFVENSKKNRFAAWGFSLRHQCFKIETSAAAASSMLINA